MSKQENLKNLTQQQLKDGADLALHNAERLVESAAVLAKKKRFGTANSLAILGVEEAVKAYVLRVHSIIPSATRELLTNVFSKHKVKHDTWFLMQMMLAFVGLFQNVVTKYKVKEDVEKLKPGTLKGAAFNEITDTLNRWANGERNSIDEAKEWYEVANKKKNLGLYIDFDGRKWVGPLDVDKDEYAASEKNARNILNIIRAFKDVDEDDMQGAYERFFSSNKNQATQ